MPNKPKFFVIQSQPVHTKNPGAINPEFKIQMMNNGISINICSICFNTKQKKKKTNYLGFILFSRKNDFPLMQKDTSFK